MRQGQQNRRGRGRNRKPQNPLSRNLESNGPDVKIRGNASHIAEKYATLARDALSSGDMVAGESYLQHAEHYNRIIMSNKAQQGDGPNAPAAERGRSNGSGEEGADNARPEAAASGSSAEDAASGSSAGDAASGSSAGDTASGSSAGDAGAEDGLARTMARSTKLSGNGADEEARSDEADDTDKKEAAGKSDADEAPDEAVT